MGTYILIGMFILGAIITYNNIKRASNKKMNKIPAVSSNTEAAEIKSTEYLRDELSLEDALNEIKKSYPFNGWRASFFEYDMEQYTEENCNSAKKILDELIQELVIIGKEADKDLKLKKFEKAVQKLNVLNDYIDGSLIETGEREQLCELFDNIGIIVGLNPEDYGDGDGIASEWRDW